MTEQQIEARRKYKREWARRNPEKVKAAAERFWTKMAERNQEEQRDTAQEVKRE